jgi:phosphoribosylaminoimidazole-succinocarboxamide synthase
VSNFWFERTRALVPNHLAELSLEEVLPDATERAQVEGRAILVRKLKALPVEAIVRGYLIGSGWKDYQASGAVCGIALPPGLRLADRLPEAIFTPSTKAEVGDHDENIDFARAEALLGAELAAQVRDVSLKIYTEAAEYARQRGIIIADTKFEFGVDNDGTLVLIDEALTPDSSRFWPEDEYRVGISPPSFDKQFVRDYLETLDWDKTPPGPALPASIIERTAEKYREALKRLTGHDLP